MAWLGYQRYVAQGGDWGAAVTIAMGRLAPPQLAGIHLNMPLVIPRTAERADPDSDQQAAVEALARYNSREAAYARLQATRPQTLGYALADWNELDRGGHFGAFEQPELFVQELRACFSRMV